MITYCSINYIFNIVPERIGSSVGMEASSTGFKVVEVIMETIFGYFFFFFFGSKLYFLVLNLVVVVVVANSNGSVRNLEYIVYFVSFFFFWLKMGKKWGKLVLYVFVFF